jgi:hypothetical protein
MVWRIQERSIFEMTVVAVALIDMNTDVVQSRR